MRKDTIVEISSIIQCQKIPDGIRIILENHFFPKLETAKTHLALPKTSKNQKFQKKNRFFPKMSQVSRIAAKTPLICIGFVFHVRGFGCVQSQVLDTNGKSAQCTRSGT